MTEERGTYHLQRVDPDRSLDGVERIDDILHRLIDERPDVALCPRCAGEQVRVYRPGARRPAADHQPDAAGDLLVPLLQDLDREQAVTLNLDARHRLVATTTVSIGSVDHTFMAPREVFRDALLQGAGAIVIAHNHPSGDAEPSRDDERITRRLGQAGEILGVDVLDHLSATSAGSPSPGAAPSSTEAPPPTSATTGRTR